MPWANAGIAHSVTAPATARANWGMDLRITVLAYFDCKFSRRSPHYPSTLENGPRMCLPTAIGSRTAVTSRVSKIGRGAHAPNYSIANGRFLSKSARWAIDILSRSTRKV